MKPLIILLVLAAVAVAAPKIPETLTIDGETYKNCSYSSHDASTVVIMHEFGIMRIDIKKLPPELQAELGYKEDVAEQHRAKQKEQQAQQAKNMAAQLEEKRFKEQAMKEGKEIHAKVWQVTPEGILADKMERGSLRGPLAAYVESGSIRLPLERMVAMDDNAYDTSGTSIFITGYKWPVAENETIKFLGMEDGMHEYTDVRGVRRVIRKWRTVIAWDWGTNHQK